MPRNVCSRHLLELAARSLVDSTETVSLTWSTKTVPLLRQTARILGSVGFHCSVLRTTPTTAAGRGGGEGGGGEIDQRLIENTSYSYTEKLD